MKAFKIILIWFVAWLYITFFGFKDNVYAFQSNDVANIVESVDKYYKIFFDYVDWKTNTIWFEKIKTKIQDRIRNSLLSWLEKKITSMNGDDKIIFQSIWSKILERKKPLPYNTSELVVQWDLINIINDFRKEKWLSQLSYNSILAQAAYNHANDMYLHFPYDTNWDGVKENLSHVGTDGSRVNFRVQTLWYNYSVIGENIWYNQQNANEVLVDRENSPTHYDNLVLEKATQIWVAKLWSYWVLVIGSERKNL